MTARGKTEARRAEWVLEVPKAMGRKYGTEHRCHLDHETPWQLLIAVTISAQCTDAKVNITTKDPFQKYDTLEKLAEADLKELEQGIHSANFYHNKARDVTACCRELVEWYSGEMPGTIEELASLVGVGWKMADVIRGNIYKEPSIVVNTHVKRIPRKLGFAEEEDLKKIEYKLMKVIPKDHWVLWNIQIITLGRGIYFARSPKYEECFLRKYCPSAETKGTTKPKSRKGESS